MRVAVLGDIHSNDYALQRVLEDADRQRVDRFAFCGDYVSDGPDTEAVTDRIRSLTDLIVRGNREQYMLDYRGGNPAGWVEGPMYSSFLWIYHRIAPATLDWFGALPDCLPIAPDGCRILLSHGSPYGQRHLVRPDATALFERLIADYDSEIFVFAHSHRPWQRCYRGRLFLNPGSVGMPTDGPGFKYAIIDTDSRSATLRAVPYDFNTIAPYYEKHGFLASTGIWGRIFLAVLRDNRDYMPLFINTLTATLKRQGLTAFSQIPDADFAALSKDWERRLFERSNP